MAFDFSTFFGGLVEGAGREVEQKNKQISDTANTEFEKLRKEAEEQNEKLRTNRDKLKSTAEVLSSYRGKNNAGFTEAQVIGLLQNPAVAKRVQETLDKNADSLDQVDFEKLFTISKGNTDQKVEDYIKSRTTITPEVDPATGKPVQKTQATQVKTAFGLPSNAMARAEKTFEASAGKSIAQLRTEAKGVAPEVNKAEGVLDLSQFRGYAQELNDKKTAYMREKDPAKKAELKKQVTELVQVGNLGKNEAPSFSEFNTLVGNAERSAIESIKGPTKGLSYDKDRGRFVYVGADPVQRARVENARLEGIKEIVDLYADADGRVGKDLQGVLASRGVKFDKAGRPILKVEVPPAPGGEGTAAAPGKGNTPPPAEAIAALKANPKLAEDFTKKYPAYPASLYLQK
jgi:hypothetical protein